MKNIFLYTFVITVAVSSCDKVTQPYISTSTGGVTPAGKVRKVLIEEFTGQKCGNCPIGATTIQTIKAANPGKVISIAVHSNFYSIPGSAPYTYDFRTIPGNDYDVFFSPPGWPTGMINRKDYPSTTHWKSVSNWSSIIDSLLANTPDADIQITNSYNSSTRLLNASVRTEFLKPLSGNYKIMALLIEDSIVSPQKFYSPAVDSLTYVHHHILRDAISSTSWGDMLVTGLVAAGDTAVKTFQYTLPANFKGKVPQEKYCYVVAYVYDASTYEIIQVEEKKIK